MFRFYGLHVLSLILLAAVDIAFVSQLPFGLYYLHTLPIALVFVFLLNKTRMAAWWVVGAGLILEVFNFGAYGLYLCGLLASLLVIVLLFERVITNHSLYSVSVVAMSSVLVFDFMTRLGKIFSGLTVSSWGRFLEIEVIVLLYTLIISVTVFYMINTITRRLRPVFLAKKDYQL